MKKFRFLAFLCALILLVSAMSFASAAKKGPVRIQTATVDNAMGWHNNRILKNKEKVTFLMNAFAWDIYEQGEEGYIEYNNIIYDCEGKVTAKTSTSWIHVEKTKPGFILSFDSNPTMKNRTGKVTVTGKGYKAVMTFKQNGRDEMVSVSRKKNKVTVKVKYGSAALHRISVNAYKYDDDGTYMSKSILSEEATKTSYTFKVQKGWNYNIGVGPEITTQWGGWTFDWTGSCYFYVEKVTGSETFTVSNKSNKVTLTK